ncbi:hypothetical protein [uncultured Leifsonia sp.]|uniref:hypothetical protein n=1 Tax=uncultured Leifsonia sp. TaxID=340359 RepID=UPI0025D1F002|nr:hypothetical protein [uncultured Leifsonia sp.]
MDNLETAEAAIREARAKLAAATGAPAAASGAWAEPLRLALDAIESAVAELSELRDQPRENTGETGPDASYIP